jgi:hypothetical protein
MTEPTTIRHNKIILICALEHNQLREQYISTLPIPANGLGHDPSLAFQSSLAADAADSRSQKINAFLRRIPDLCPLDRAPKLTTRLREW